MPLALSTAIVGSNEFRYTELEQTLADLGRLAQETVDAPDISRSDRVYLMSAVLTHNRDRLWGAAIEHLNDEEFPAVCPRCGSDLYFRIGNEGCFTIHDFNPTTGTRREEITPCEDVELRGPGPWLHSVAARSGDASLAHRIRCVFGTSTCCVCNAAIRVDEAIERFETGVGAPSD